ncbi:MAG: rhombotarget lipoprotein [Gammaproteobacteria bacterium]|nr:rhombotarget lipoprotein [Gammaproteobacteria bacterium]
MRGQLLRFVAIGLIASLTGCSGLWQAMGHDSSRQGVSSSLVDFLYPRGEAPPEQDGSVPRLQLPLRAGLAFVPGNLRKGLSEEHKMELLNRVKQAFQEREFIQKIEVIPDAYLNSGRGFDTVDQIARLHGLDVMALVSYDQVIYAEDTAASILYWTIVGAYLIKGSTNDVHTFVDTSVFDISSRKLLFRAPGTDRLEGKSTLVGSIETTRRGQEAGFENAMADMTTNLEQALDEFVIQVKREQVAEVSYRKGYTGGGGAGSIGLLMLLLSITWIRRFKQ